MPDTYKVVFNCLIIFDGTDANKPKNNESTMYLNSTLPRWKKCDTSGLLTIAIVTLKRMPIVTISLLEKCGNVSSNTNPILPKSTVKSINVLTLSSGKFLSINKKIIANTLTKTPASADVRIVVLPISSLELFSPKLARFSKVKAEMGCTINSNKMIKV